MRKPCCDEKHTNKGAWTEQEDQKLIDYIRIHGEGCWRTLAKQAGLHRCGKSCRLRWINYLRPDIKRGNFAQDEEDLIVKLHALLGNRWALIAGRLPGRTDSEVKNYWNCHLRRKLISMGIDPQNHRVHQTQTMHHHPPPQDDDDAIVGEPESNSRSHPPVGLGLKSSCSKMISESSSKPLHREAMTMMSSVADHHDEQVSDAGSILVDQTIISCSGELNLDLTIGFPSSSQHPLISEQNHNQESKQGMHLSKEVAGDPYPTLPLYL